MIMRLVWIVGGAGVGFGVAIFASLIAGFVFAMIGIDRAVVETMAEVHIYIGLVGGAVAGYIVSSRRVRRPPSP